MSIPRLIEFQQIGDDEIGFISVAHNFKEVPFEIKRVYWVYNTPKTVERGNHANRIGENVIVSLKGSVSIVLENQLGIHYNYILDNPNQGLYVPPLHWRKLHMSSDVVCLSISSSDFEENDYIRDYQEFLSIK